MGGVFLFRKIIIGLLIIASSSFIAFQIITFINTMFTIETITVPGEEDVVIRTGDNTSNNLTITCNVDWGEDLLPEMLEILKEKDVIITFFVSGKWAKNNPYLLRKIYIAGHEIQSHGYSHKLCSKISADEVIEEIRKTEEVIYELVNTKTTVFAPPSGDYDSKTVDICRKMDYILSLWSIDTIDWRAGSTASVITERVLSKELNGGIILMHPKEETVKALPLLIDAIRERNINIVPLYQLVDYDSMKAKP